MFSIQLLFGQCSILNSAQNFDSSHSLHIMSIIDPLEPRGESGGVATCPVDRRAAGAAEACGRSTRLDRGVYKTMLVSRFDPFFLSKAA